VIARSRIPYISAVKGFYKFAAARGICRRNAARELEHPKPGKPLPRTISLANAEKLMWAPDMGTFIGIRDAAMLALLVGCGPRISGLVRAERKRPAQPCRSATNRASRSR
jgi:integrase/recombinase XerD